MDDQRSFSKLGFAKTFLLPLLFVFVIPGFSLWFFDHAEQKFDTMIRASILAEIDADKALSSEKKSEARRFYREVSIAQVLATSDPKLKAFQESFDSSLRQRYAQFRWGKRLSALCLLSALGAFVFSLAFVGLSLRSQALQYYCLSINWHLLKLVCVIQVVCQGVLVVGLSFWVTALWMEVYAVKLVVVAAFLALAAVVMILQATFTTPDNSFHIWGTLLDPGKSPRFMEKIGSICRHLGIGPPDHVVAGIDDNFFVTESPALVSDKLEQAQPTPIQGKTLYVSVSLLKKLELDEAEAILAHEMAHFSGQDTTYSRKISPLVGRYGLYLEALYEGGISRPVFHFMHFFWSLYQLSLSRLSRAREFRADRVAAEVTSPQAMARSLAKVGAYSYYRSKVEGDLFGEDQVHNQLNILTRVETGFAGFVNSIDLRQEVYGLHVPHPFDSHPPLEERLSNVGLDLSCVEKDALVEDVETSWFDGIGEAEEIEQAMWQGYEEAFKRVHEEDLAFRLTPTEEWQLELVKKFFPGETVDGKKGASFRFEWDGMRFSEWDEPVRYEQVKSLAADDDTLTIDREGGKALTVKLKQFPRAGELVAILDRYYGRHVVAAAYAQHTAERPTKAPGDGDSETPSPR